MKITAKDMIQEMPDLAHIHIEHSQIKTEDVIEYIYHLRKADEVFNRFKCEWWAGLIKRQFASTTGKLPADE